MTRDHFVYRVYDEGDRILYVGCTKHLQTRSQQHANRSPWWAYKDHYVIRGPYAKHDAYQVEAQMIEDLRPPYNRVAGRGTSADRRLVSKTYLRQAVTAQHRHVSAIAADADIPVSLLGHLLRDPKFATARWTCSAQTAVAIERALDVPPGVLFAHDHASVLSIHDAVVVS